MAALLGGAFPAVASSEAVPIAIIVSAEWESVNQVSVRDLRRIYLRTSKQLAGVALVPVDRAPRSAIFDAFLSQVLKKPRKVLEDYWLEEALTGGKRPPRQLESGRDVIDFVARHVGAIAYVGLDALETAGNPGVKVLALSQRDGVLRPSQPGYELSYLKP